MKTSDFFIKGLGVYLPPTVSVEWALERGLYSADDIQSYDLAGAAVAGDTPAPEMALRAAQDALKRCGVRPDEVSLLLYANTWLQGPEGWLPCSYLQHHLLGGDPLALEVRQGCGGMFGALELAASYLRADSARQTALLVAADNYGTPLMDRWRMGPFIAGDAATAVVLAREPGFAKLLSVCSLTVPEAGEELTVTGEPLFPPGVTVGRGVDFTARRAALMQNPSARAAGAARMIKVHQKTLEIVETALSEAGITMADVTRMATVNIARDIIQKRGIDALGIDMSKSTWEFGRTIGHCGASDQILSLDHLVSNGELSVGDHLLMLGSGPGVVLSCAVVKIVGNPPWVGDPALPQRSRDLAM